MDDAIGDDKIAIPLTVGRHNVPGRIFSTGCGNDVFEGFHIIVPELAFLEISGVPLPSLFRVLNSFFQPLFLFGFGDMEEKLQYYRAIFLEEIFKFLDLM